LDQIRQQILHREVSVGDAVLKALPLLKAKVSDEILLWLVSELQGYTNAVEFYQTKKAAHNLPEYRVVTGRLKLMDSAGSLKELRHAFAERGTYFLGAPVSWLEQFASLPGDTALAECPELTSYLASGDGMVICEFSKSQLVTIIAQVRTKLLELLDQAAQEEATKGVVS
jgi:hypothetical protein